MSYRHPVVINIDTVLVVLNMENNVKSRKHGVQQIVTRGTNIFPVLIFMELNIQPSVFFQGLTRVIDITPSFIHGRIKHFFTRISHIG